MTTSRSIAALFLLLGTVAAAGDEAWDDDDGLRMKMSPVKPGLFLGVDAAVALRKIQPGEPFQFDLVASDGSVFELLELALTIETDANAVLESSSRQTLRNLDPVSPGRRTRIRGRLRGERSELTIRFSARYGGEDKSPMTGQFTVPIGRLRTSERQSDTSLIRGELVHGSGSALRSCWQQAPLRKATKEVLSAVAWVRVDPSGQIAPFKFEEDWANELKCLKDAVARSELPALGRETKVQLVFVFFPSGEVLVRQRGLYR